MGRWGQEGDSGGGRAVAAAGGTGFPGHLGRMLQIPALSPRAVLSPEMLEGGVGRWPQSRLDAQLSFSLALSLGSQVGQWHWEKINSFSSAIS